MQAMSEFVNTVKKSKHFHSLDFVFQKELKDLEIREKEQNNNFFR